VILRFTDNKGLLLDGPSRQGTSIAEHAVVVDAHLGQGNVLLFGNNPIYPAKRWEPTAWYSTRS